MTYIVTAPAVVAYKPDGGHVMFYKDAVLPEGLRAGERDRLTEAGMVENRDAIPHFDPGSAEDPGTVGGGSGPPENADEMPAKSASRADWDVFARSAAGGSLTDEQIAEYTTKEALQAHYGVE